MAHRNRGWMTYTSSPDAPWGTRVMSIKCDENTAQQNGTTFAETPITKEFWPGHRSDLRMVYGVDSNGKTDSMVVSDPGSPLYALGVTFQDNEGNSYKVTGLKPERIKTKNLK